MAQVWVASGCPFRSPMLGSRMLQVGIEICFPGNILVQLRRMELGAGAEACSNGCVAWTEG